MKAEDKIEKDNASTSYSYYHRSSMPANTDFESVKAFLDNKEVQINAALKENFKPVSRDIPIENAKKQ